MPTAQVLVVSPDRTVLHAAQRSVRALGHAPFLARTLREAQRAAARVKIDLICLDSVLPCAEAERFWRSLHVGEGLPPAIFFAPRSAQLVPGALPSLFREQRDALVVKPLDGRELARAVARALAAGRSRDRDFGLVRAGSVALDTVEQQLIFACGGVLQLTPTEFRLVCFLMERPKTLVPVDQLLEQVWGFAPGTGGAEVVRAHVSNVRRKLRSMDEDSQLLRSVPYRGYGFFAEEQAANGE